MGTISRSHTFISGEVPTAAQWNVDIDQLFTLVNGNLDGSNVDESGSDGVMTLDTNQTVSGTKTFTEAIVTAIEERSAAAGGIRTATAFRHDPASGTAADNDGVEVLFQGDNDNSGEQATYGEIECVFTDVSNASEDADFYLKTMVGGTARNVLSIGSAGTVFNQDSQDLDFRIETNDIANGFTIDAGLNTFAFGAAAVDDQFVQISTPTATHTATTNTYAVNVTPGGAQTIPSGTTTYVGSVNIEEPNITATGTVTNAFTLRIGGAPTEGGTANYALWVDAGATQLDSTLTVGSTITSAAITATDTTAPLILKYDAGEYVTHAVSSAGVYSIATTDATSDSGAITLDTVDSITLDSDTAAEGIVYADGGTNLLRISNSSSDVIIKPLVDAKDIVFQQFDGSEVCRITDNRRLYFYDEGGEYISSSGSALTIASGGVAWELPAADGDADQYLKTDGSGNLDWASVASGGATLTGSTNNTVVTVTGSNAIAGEASFTYDDTNGLGVTSATASLPVLTIQNTHADATAGYLKFIKDPGSGQGADSDTLGTITFFGTDAGNNAPEELARIESYIVEADHGSEAAGMKFYVAENDATVTVGLHLAGQASADGEVDVTIGAGAASTTTIAGTLDLGDRNITNVGDISLDSITGDGDANSNITFAGSDIITVATGGSERARIDANGAMFVGDTTSATVTTGLTLNQGAAADTILEGKSSDVAHGMTGMTETDTFFDFQKRDSAGGGLRIRGFRDADAAAGGALVVQGALGEAADTTTGTSATSVTEVGAVVRDGSPPGTGTGAEGVANGGNAVGIYNASTCRFLVKGNGDLHGSDTSIASFDDMPDFIAGRAYQTAHARQQGEGLLGGMEIHRPDLVRRMEEAGIVTPAELPGEGHIPGHRFMNLQKSIKFSWDMGFQLGSWMNEIVKVLTPKQKAKLPLQMREAFAELEEAA